MNKEKINQVLNQYDSIIRLRNDVWKLIFFTIITFGIYPSYWLLMIRRHLPYYEGKLKIDKHIPLLTIIGSIVLAMNSIIEGITNVYLPLYVYNEYIIKLGDYLVIVINILYFFHIALCVLLREKLIALGISKSNVSLFKTIIFQIFYIQLVINRNTKTQEV